MNGLGDRLFDLASDIRSHIAISPIAVEHMAVEADRLAARVAVVEAERDRLAEGVRALVDEYEEAALPLETTTDACLWAVAHRLRSLLGAAETTGDRP